MNRSVSGFEMHQTLKPTVLFYNLVQDDRTREIENYLTRAGISYIHVAPPEYHRQIAALLGLSGADRKRPSTAFPLFREEMLVMAGFTQAQLNAFLAFFQENNVKRVSLKAMLTPTNAFWSGAELVEHLKQEQAQFAKAAKR